MRGCGGEETFFQTRYHAYRDIAWYFGFFVVINFCFGVWAFSIIDTKDTNKLKPRPLRDDCNHINVFLEIYGGICFTECLQCALLVATLHAMPRSPTCAGFTLLVASSFFLLFMIKGLGLVLGVVWLWDDDARICESKVTWLFHQASDYLGIVLLQFAFQLFVGNAFLVVCGMADAMSEAMYRFRQLRSSKDNDKLSNMENGKRKRRQSRHAARQGY